jgi:hypothetical protein
MLAIRKRHPNLRMKFIVPLFSKAELSFPVLFEEPPCIPTGPNIATGITEQLPSLQSVHRLGINIAGAFIVPLPTKKNKILIVKSSLRHWLQVPNFFIALLQTAVCSRQKATDRSVCTSGNSFKISRAV